MIAYSVPVMRCQGYQGRSTFGPMGRRQKHAVTWQQWVQRQVNQQSESERERQGETTTEREADRPRQSMTLTPPLRSTLGKRAEVARRPVPNANTVPSAAGTLRRGLVRLRRPNKGEMGIEKGLERNWSDTLQNKIMRTDSTSVNDKETCKKEVDPIKYIFSNECCYTARGCLLRGSTKTRTRGAEVETVYCHGWVCGDGWLNLGTLIAPCSTGVQPHLAPVSN